MTNFAIQITSDTICPWCYVGARKLAAGIGLYKDKHPGNGDTFQTKWLPFQLNPQAPTKGVNKKEYYAMRFGPDKAATIYEHLGRAAKSVGINISFGGKTGNTRDSHRLIYLAEEKGGLDLQNKLVDRLNRSYFEQEGDITDHSVLTAAAVDVGLDEKEVRGWLESDVGGAEVDREVQMAYAKGIHGVPHFVMQNKYEIGGAQNPESFVSIFEKVKEMEASENERKS